MKKRHLLFYSSVLIFLPLFFTSTIIKAVEPKPPESLIPRIDPARVKQSLEQHVTPKYVPKPSIPITKPLGGPSGAAPMQFVLKNIVLDGVTVYKPEQLQPIFAQYIGKKISLADLQAIVNAITVKYRNDGYILSQAILPKQKIEKGVVHIQIIEGYISDFSIEGNANGAKKFLTSYGQKIVADRPLSMKTLEKYTLLANDLPGMEIKTVLSPSKTASGASEIIFVVNQTRFSSSASYDNRGTEYIGPEQISATLEADDPYRAGDRLTLTGVATPTTDELRFVQLGYMIPLGTSGLRLSVNGDVIETNPDFTLEQWNLMGRSKSWEANLSYPFYRSRRSNFNTNLKFDWLDSQTDFLGTPMFNDHIRSIRLSGNFDYIDDERGSNTAKLEFSKGLKAFGASDIDSLTSTRPIEKPDYNKFNLDLSRLQALSSHFSLLLAASGQYSFNQALLSAEEFGFGGNQFGRAYDSSEIAGDDGVVGKAELQLNTYPGFSWLRYIQYYTFYDAGMVWNIGGHNQQLFRQSATSTGIGTRIHLNNYVYGNFELDKALTLPVQTLIADHKDGNGIRFFFSLNAAL